MAAHISLFLFFLRPTFWEWRQFMLCIVLEYKKKYLIGERKETLVCDNFFLVFNDQCIRVHLRHSFLFVKNWFLIITRCDSEDIPEKLHSPRCSVSWVELQNYLFIFHEPSKLILFDKNCFFWLYEQISGSGCTYIYYLAQYTMRFDDINLENSNFFIFFQVFQLIVANFSKKKYSISANILKVYSLVKRLSLHLIKLDKNYRSYNWNNITVVLYFLYTSVIKWTFCSKSLKSFDRSWLFMAKCVNFSFARKSDVV